MAHGSVECKNQRQVGLGTFYPKDRVPQWAVEVVITSTNVDMWEVVDVVEKKVNGCVVFVVIKA